MSQLPLPHPILQQQFGSSQVAFTQIDKEIAVLREGIRALHAFRNTFTPVYRLPPEILARIFSFFQHAQRHGTENSSRISLHWVVVMRVSQHWRDVAIGSPNLWSHISSSYPKRITQEWLRRSKGASLSINLRHISSLPSEFFSTSLSRIREMTLEFSSSTWRKLLPKLTSTAPLLEYLSILISDSTTEDPPITNSVFVGATPRLRHLELVGCSVDISSSLFKDLTTLYLNSPPLKLSITDLLTALHNLSSLTSLSLIHVLQSGGIRASGDIDAINLPFLKSLTISGHSFVQDLDILSHLSFPINSTLRFHSEASSGGAIPLLLDFLNVHKSSRQQATTFLINSIDLQCAVGVLMLDLNSRCDKPAYVTDLVKFELVGPWPDGLSITESSEATALFSSFNLTSMTHFSTNCNFSIRIWTDLFGSLPNLNRIAPSGTSTVLFLVCIIEDCKAKCPAQYKPQIKPNTKGKKKKGKGGKGKQKAPVASTSAPQVVDWAPIFPGLETIQIIDGAFTERIMDDLIIALHARKVTGKGIKVFGMMECRNVDELVIDRLRHVVQQVMWDEWTGSEDEDEFMYGSQYSGDDLGYDEYGMDSDADEWGMYTF
ncbi:hypothetical protein BDN72DRAFT_846207 [Pluteus cervinus]|uniref:Uncharacterized protein n=1 Tax=Pluteus cervinus TaxID=181527 RepID=A0ACD3AHX2_9AGAR|nr:hypothetical protein BDN72DRAFT_846207 [Pluteus cervinus]